MQDAGLLIYQALGALMTHRVTTVYESGATKTHDAASLKQAENWAIGERRKIGQNRVERVGGATIRVVEVRIEVL